MRKIHSFLILLIALTSSEIASAQIIQAPTPPTITGSLVEGSYTVTGTAQNKTSNDFTQVAVYVCISATNPAAPPPTTTSAAKPAAQPSKLTPCIDPPTHKSAPLSNPAVQSAPKGDYVLADENGNFAAILKDKLKSGQYVYITEVATTTTGDQISGVPSAATTVAAATTQCNPKWVTNPFSDCDLKISIIGGVEQSAQSSLSSATTPFLRVFSRADVVSRDDDPTQARATSNLKVWGGVRLLGAPTTSSTNGVVSVVTDPTGALTTQTFSTIGTSIDYMAGLEYVLRFKKEQYNKEKYTASLIVGFGGTTPLQANTLALAYQAPPFGTVECNQLFSRFQSQFVADNIALATSTNIIIPSGTTNPPACLVNQNSPTTAKGATTPTYTAINTIGFSNQDRTNFLGKDIFGIRTIERFPGSGKKACGDADTANPVGPCERGIVDWTFGQDASLTGGQMRHWVFKIDGVHPLPIPNIDFLYLFGTVGIRLTRNTNYPPLVLQSAAISTLTGTGSSAVPNPSVAVLSLVQPNRDFYRFGAGININKIFTKLFSSSPPPATKAP